MTEIVFISGLLLGLVSSAHCIGMCGPIALALPFPDRRPSTRLKGVFLYNSGRVLTYAMLGAVMGLIGRSFYIGGWQQWFSILAGLAIIIFTCYTMFSRKAHRVAPGIGAKIQQWLGYWFNKRKTSALLAAGMANGLLPCGMVHLAITAALTTSRSVPDGVLFMTFFGLGTLPAMIAFSFFGASMKLSVRNHIRRAVPYIALFMGVLLILRGLNLGIPFLSPALPETPGQAIPCY